ncbi:MAG: hypothetical protein V4568_14420 [Pseudomonadota bacterium]
MAPEQSEEQGSHASSDLENERGELVAAKDSIDSRVLQKITEEYLGTKPLIAEHASDNNLQAEECAWEPLGMPQRQEQDSPQNTVVRSNSQKTCLMITEGTLHVFSSIDTSEFNSLLGQPETTVPETQELVGLNWTDGKLTHIHRTIDALTDGIAQSYGDNVQKEAIMSYLQTQTSGQIEGLYKKMIGGGQEFKVALQEGLVTHLNKRSPEQVLTVAAVDMLANLVSIQRNDIESGVVKQHLKELTPLATAEFLKDLPDQRAFMVLEQIEKTKRAAPRHSEAWRRHYITERYKLIKEQLVAETGSSNAANKLDQKFGTVLNIMTSQKRGEMLRESDDAFLAKIKSALQENVERARRQGSVDTGQPTGRPVSGKGTRGRG